MTEEEIMILNKITKETEKAIGGLVDNQKNIFEAIKKLGLIVQELENKIDYLLSSPLSEGERTLPEYLLSKERLNG